MEETAVLIAALAALLDNWQHLHFFSEARVLGIGREDDPAGTTGSAQPVHSSHRNSGWPEPRDQTLIG